MKDTFSTMKHSGWILNLCVLCCILATLVFLGYIFSDILVHQHTSQTDKVSAVKYSDRETLLNAPFTESDVVLSSTFHRLVESRATPENPELVGLARAILEKPSEHPYKVRSVPITPQNKAVMEILNKKRGGFFVECGANDGDTSSNSLYLEAELGWTGLLVEMDFFTYTKLRAKARKAHSVNVCMSTSRHPMMIEVTDALHGGGRMFPANKTYDSIDQLFGARLGERAPCLPFDSLLSAMDKWHVDYFSLDVEGYELDVLRTISWDKFTIDVLSVEYKVIAEGKLPLRRFMESLGYVTFDDIHFSDGKRHIHVWDYIFVRKDVLDRSGIPPRVSTYDD